MIKLYAIFPYDRSAKVRWLLTQMGIPFEDRWLDREKSEHESPEYLRVNPMGRVPAVEIDGRAMIESDAICQYLADRHLEKKMAPPLDSPERAEYQQWMHFAGASLQSVQTRIQIVEDIPAGEVFEAKQAAVLEDLRDAAFMLERALARRETLLASGFSAADICVGYHLYFLYMWPELETVLRDFPRVGAYFERLKQHPAALKAQVFSYN